MTRRLTESGASAHAKDHDLQHRGARKKVIGNRASTKNQGDVKKPPNQTSPNHGNNNSSRRGVLCASDFLADMPANESEYMIVPGGHTDVRDGVIIRHTLTESISVIGSEDDQDWYLRPLNTVNVIQYLSNENQSVAISAHLRRPNLKAHEYAHQLMGSRLTRKQSLAASYTQAHRYR